MSAAWHWVYESSSREQVGTSPDFESRSDAESFIGTDFEDLLEQGVDQVRLFEGDTEVYGPMSLHPQ